jgi:hypothetical protein
MTMPNLLTDLIKEVSVHGKPYKLKPYSAKYRGILNDKGTDLQAQLAVGAITEFEYYDRLLRLIVVDENPTWDTTADDFDGREAEDAFMSFFPPSMRLYMMLTGLQKS